MPSDEPESVAVQKEVIAWVFERYRKDYAFEFVRGADTWLVAYAKVHALPIVTLETWNPSEKKVKIPKACRHFGVTTLPLVQLLRRLSVRLVWSPPR